MKAIIAGGQSQRGEKVVKMMSLGTSLTDRVELHFLRKEKHTYNPVDLYWMRKVRQDFTELELPLFLCIFLDVFYFTIGDRDL